MIPSDVRTCDQQCWFQRTLLHGCSSELIVCLLLLSFVLILFLNQVGESVIVSGLKLHLCLETHACSSWKCWFVHEA